MTEAEWLTCLEANPMLKFLDGKASQRKLRLFACACARGIRPFYRDERLVSAVQDAERYADGVASAEDFRAAREAVLAVYPPGSGWEKMGDVEWHMDHYWGLHFENSLEENGRIACVFAALVVTSEPIRPRHLRYATTLLYGFAREYGFGVVQPCRLVRDIFGNPFDPVALDRAWLTAPVTDLARSIHEDHAGYRMPQLADALERAGCSDAAILSHCRDPEPHVRGCWLVDLLTRSATQYP